MRRASDTNDERPSAFAEIARLTSPQIQGCRLRMLRYGERTRLPSKLPRTDILDASDFF